MISVQEAENIVLSNLYQPIIKTLDLLDSLACVLAEDIVADRPFPPFNRVTMDGIAIDFQAGKRIFNIEGTAPAGKPQIVLQNPENCIEVMTGAILPQNCNAVIRYEDLKIENNEAEVQIENIQIGQNIHTQGQDRKQGEIIVKAGKKITSAEIGIMATVGKQQVKVQIQPRVLVISTGDELVEVETIPKQHQIRISNAYTICATLTTWGIKADRTHLPDNENIIKEKLKTALENYDAIILSGGVSAGKFDFIPQVLETLGVEKRFHQVAQRPGKPFWFGTKQQKCVFALPGNPVSTFMCLNRYVKPWIGASLGVKTPAMYASLAETVKFKPNLTYFLQVRVEQKEATFWAYPVAGGGSGDLANLTDANAFLELPAGQETFEAGTIFRVFLYR